ncbi:MAG: hypothetical protein KC619_11025, partial [Myxococcales bacterium]|nr:hypothetical protein [Myxococcales bacterium]
EEGPLDEVEPEPEPQPHPEPEPEPITEPEEPLPESSPPTLLVSALVGAFIPQVFNRLDASFLVSIGVGYVLPFLDYRLAVVVDAFYSRPERSQTIDDPRLTASQYSYTLIQNNASVFIGAHYHFMSLTDDMFVPYVGLGVRMHFLPSEIDGMSNAEALGYHTEFSVKAGGALRGGLGVHLGPGMITAEVELALAPIDHLVTGDENVGDLSIAAGYRFIF